MRARFGGNPEARAAILKTVIAAILFTGLAIFYFSQLFGSLDKSLLERNIAVAGSLIVRHPELRDDIAAAYAGRADEKAKQAGIAAAKEYGLTENLPIWAGLLPEGFLNAGLAGAAVLALLCFVAAGLISELEKRKLYTRVREAADAAEGIVEGDFGIRLEESDEGDFSKLGHQFNQMAKRLELSIEQLRNEKIFLKNMISDISHQLKTPLSSIKVFNEILAGGKAVDEADRSRFLQKSGEQLDRMEWLIQNLLLMARLEAGAIAFTNEYKPLLPTVEAAVEALREKWEAKGLEVKLVHGREKEISAAHDERWLEEAVSNIVKNSIEHTGAGGHIEIEINGTPVMSNIIVRDDGEGISPEDLPHIFERFYKGRNKAPGSGTGIGLALARSIIENQGGIISVSSAPGKETVFTVSFSNLTKL